MGKRASIVLGMAGGLAWGLAALWIGARLVDLPVMALVPTVLVAFLAPGRVLAAMIGRLARHRFFDDGLIDGAPFVPGTPAARGQAVLTNTVEQIVLALCVWPAAAVLLGANGPGVIVTLGLSFALARLLFWAGYALSPPLRALGFAASFYPTVMVALWALAGLAW